MRVCQFRHTRKMQKTPKNSVSFAKLEHFRTLPNCPVADKAGHSRTLNYLRASKMVTGGHIRGRIRDNATDRDTSQRSAIFWSLATSADCRRQAPKSSS